MALPKTDKANLRSRYPIYMEVGFIVTLLLLIAAFRVNVTREEPEEIVMEEQEQIQIEEIVRTKLERQPPPPPRPPVPVEKPDDEVLEDIELKLDAIFDINEPLDVPPPPAPPPTGDDAEEETIIFVIVENMPEMQPSQEEGMRSLQQCIEYPEMARRAGVQGRVFVQFVVDEQGNVQNPVVTRGQGAGLDEEALRCVRTVKFSPGMQRGQPVQVQMSLPVTFRLQ